MSHSKTYNRPDRDAQARAELGQTKISSWTALYLAALFLLTLISVPLARWNLEDNAVPGLASLLSRPAGESWLERNHSAQRQIDAFERQLEETSPLLRRTLPHVQNALMHLGRIGNERVYVGRENWLHLREDVDLLIGPPFLDPAVLERRRRAAPTWSEGIEPDSRPALFDFAKQLQGLGIRLILIPVPSKAAILPGTLTRAARGREPENPSMATWRRTLEDGGLEIFDPSALLRDLQAQGDPAFLRTDTHWSPRAVDRMAEELAGRLLRRGTLDDESPAIFQRHPLTLRGRGDLLHMLRLAEPRLAELSETVEVQQVLTADGSLWRSDREASVLVLGDSFVNVYSDSELGWGTAAGLAEQLAFHLQRPVDRLATNGGGASEVRRRLGLVAREDPERLKRKTVVLYVFASRELASGDWQKTKIAVRAGHAADSGIGLEVR